MKFYSSLTYLVHPRLFQAYNVEDEIKMEKLNREKEHARKKTFRAFELISPAKADQTKGKGSVGKSYVINVAIPSVSTT